MKRSLGRKTKAAARRAAAATPAPEGGNQAAAEAQQARREARRHRVFVWQRRILVFALIIAVFVIAGLAGSVVRTHKDKALATPSAAASPSGLSISVPGRSPVVLTVWEDMRDPASEAFQKQYGPTLDHLLSMGLVVVHYREVTEVDAAKGGTGSLRAGNALACAQDAKRFPDYRRVLLAHQPAAGDDAFADDAYLIKLARQVKGLDSDTFKDCVNGVGHTVWVKDNQKAYAAAGFGAMPVLQMEVPETETAPGTGNIRTLLPEAPSTPAGKRLTPSKLSALVLKTAQAAPTSTPSPTATS